MRYKDIGFIQPAERLGEVCFSVARLAVYQKRIAGAHRRSNLGQYPAGDHQIAIGVFQRFGRKPTRLPPLMADEPVVLEQRYRRGAGVLVLVEVLAREIASRVSEGNYGAAVADSERSFRLNQVLPLEPFDEILDNAELEAHRGCEIA